MTKCYLVCCNFFFLFILQRSHFKTRKMSRHHVGFNSETGHYEELPSDWQKKAGSPIYPLCEALIYHETPRNGFIRCPCNNYDTEFDLVRRCRDCNRFFCGRRHNLEPLEGAIKNDKRGVGIWTAGEICIFCSDEKNKK